MQRWGLVLGLMVIPVLLVAQVAVTPSGWATTAGPGVPVAQPGTPLVVTPEVHLGTYSPSPVGASNATGNLPAGAANSTLQNQTPVVPATQLQVQFAAPYPSVVGAGSEYAPGPETEVNTPSGVSTRLPYFDRGAGQFSSIYDGVGPQPNVSLGELAHEWRQKKESLNARTFTNEDINRIDQQYGPPTGGVSATAVSAGTATTETTPAQPPQNAGTNPAQPPRRSPFQPPAQMSPQPSAPPPQEQAMAQGQPPAQAPSASAEQQQPAAGGEHLANKGTLPYTASQMPTFLVVGGVACLVGLLLRRRNQRRSGVGF